LARILITNGGTHSADKWAVTTAETIFPLEDTVMVGERLIAAQKLQTKLAEVMSPHHEVVMTDEKTSLQDDPSHYNYTVDASHHVDDAVHEIVAASEGSPWEDHFAKPEVQAAIHEVVLNHMQSAQHVERLWHAAHNQSEEGDAYRARFH
jgi:hypothetical protein